MRTLISMLIALAFASTLQAQFDDFDAVEIKTHKIRDNVYMLEGMGGNIGVSVGEDGVFIVDNQFAPLYEKITAAIQQLSARPVDFVVNTHFHFDHSGGNMPFGMDGSIIAAHENSRERMLTERPIASFMKQAPYTRPALPKVTFDDNMWFHYNDDIIELLHFGPAHTDGDAIVWLKKANVVHTGDTFVMTGLPFVDVGNGGSLTGLIDSAAKLLALIDDDTVIIPGHGPLASKQDLFTFRQTLVDMRQEVAALKRAGKKMEDIDIEAFMANYPKGFLPPEDFFAVVYNDIQ